MEFRPTQLLELLVETLRQIKSLGGSRPECRRCFRDRPSWDDKSRSPRFAELQNFVAATSLLLKKCKLKDEVCFDVEVHAAC